MTKRSPGVCMFMLLFCSILLGIPASVLAQPSETKVAVVTLTVNNYGGALHWGEGDMLIPTAMGEMLDITENALAGYWTVKPASEFVTNVKSRLFPKALLSCSSMTDRISSAEADMDASYWLSCAIFSILCRANSAWDL